MYKFAYFTAPFMERKGGMKCRGNYWYWPIYASVTANTFQLPTTRSALAGKKVDDPGQCNLETGNIIMWIFN